MSALLAACSSGGFGLHSPKLPDGQPQAQGSAAVGAAAVGDWRDIDAVLLGEQHDADRHQTLEREVVQALVAQDRLAALLLEMADEGATTVALPRDADEAAVQKALQWRDKAWPWERYGPTVMTAVQAGVPVVGANLPAANVRTAMADVSLDAQLSAPALAAQRDAIRSGHCNLLPEAQIHPMTRVQVARDRSMGHLVAESVRPGKLVLLVAGAAHIDKQLGVPQHLPETVRALAVQMRAGGDAPEPTGPAAAAAAASYDRIWTTPALPPGDPCAALKR